MIITVATANAPAAIGPYSQAKTVNGLVYTSGQIPLDAVSGEIVGDDIVSQTEQTLRNLSAVLEAAGSKMENVIKTTCFLSDMADFTLFNEVYAKAFPNKPARSCVAVKSLPKNVKVEIEAIAQM